MDSCYGFVGSKHKVRWDGIKDVGRGGCQDVEESGQRGLLLLHHFPQFWVSAALLFLAWLPPAATLPVTSTMAVLQ